ncbi:conserved hypothetical protein [Ricinus communis]|uniref:Uncharacterized protein n=1 Tax=Ricinus communis TaxID=3988 RepID=B9SMV9_RICCO|nr:conserved hypothetical protein [Ricinus communis]
MALQCQDIYCLTSSDFKFSQKRNKTARGEAKSNCNMIINPNDNVLLGFGIKLYPSRWDLVGKEDGRETDNKREESRTKVGENAFKLGQVHKNLESIEVV